MAVTTPVRVCAVLFDLDDTIFDHYGCSREALRAVQASHEALAAMPFDALERAHSTFLEQIHADVMLGRLPIDEARRERFRRLFNAAGVQPPPNLVHDTAIAYRDAYIASRRAMDGAVALLPLVRARAKVGVVSNNLLEEQQQKLRHCGLDGFVDVLVVSEEVGVSKPDPHIFEVALERIGCEASAAVMVGDSWTADVVGARGAGIRPVWFNRHGAAAPEPGVDEIRALEPVDDVMRTIFDRH